MTPSGLFAPPPPRASLPWMGLASLALAAVIGSTLLFHFVDALHLQMARGEALRLTQRLVGAGHSAPGQPVHIAQLRLVPSSR